MSQLAKFQQVLILVSLNMPAQFGQNLLTTLYEQSPWWDMFRAKLLPLRFQYNIEWKSSFDLKITQEGVGISEN